MKRALLLVLLTAAVAVVGAAPAAAHHMPRYRCPTGKVRPASRPGKAVYPCDFADPMVLRAGNRWFAYASSTLWDHPGQLFPVLVSSDMRHWRFAGDALHYQPRWAYREFWAPNVTQTGPHRYVMHYSAKRRSDRVHCIGAATATSPAGPYEDHGPVACGLAQGDHGYIDPSVLVDADGRGYLYVAADTPYHISVMPLGPDLVRPSGPAQELISPDLPWHRSARHQTVEAPFVILHDGAYVLFYSAGCYCGDYRLGYATASSPLGPFTDGGHNPILRSSPALRSPGSGSVFPGPDGQPWLAFHAWAGPGPAVFLRPGMRTLRLAPLIFGADGITVEL